MKRILIYFTIIIGALLAIVILPHLLLSYSIFPFPEGSEGLSILINNATSPIISILTLMGVFLAYFSQQKNHREQMKQLRLESHYNFINDLYNKVSQDFYKDNEKGLRLQHGKIIGIINSYRSGQHPSSTMEADQKELTARISKYRYHLDNYGMLADQILGSELINAKLYKIFSKKILSDLELLYNKPLKKVLDQKTNKKHNSHNLTPLKKIIEDYFMDVNKLIKKIHQM
ncbi:hypothetical protein [Sinomicrobium sp. M5D2P17]